MHAFLDINQSNNIIGSLEDLDKKVNDEIKLIQLLSQYGAKFSSHKILFYQFEPVQKVFFIIYFIIIKTKEYIKQNSYY